MSRLSYRRMPNTHVGRTHTRPRPPSRPDDVIACQRGKEPGVRRQPETCPGSAPRPVPALAETLCPSGEKALARPACATITGVRSVAQSGSASGLGPEGRRFESYRSDHLPSGEISCKRCRMAHRYSPFTPSLPCFSFCVIPDKAGQFPTFRGGSEVAWVARGLKATVYRLEGARRTHGQQPIETHPNRRHPADP